MQNHENHALDQIPSLIKLKAPWKSMNIYFPLKWLGPKYTKWVHDKSHLIFIIALYTVTQNASNNHQTQNTQPKFMRSSRKFSPAKAEPTLGVCYCCCLFQKIQKYYEQSTIKFSEFSSRYTLHRNCNNNLIYIQAGQFTSKIHNFHSRPQMDT